VSDDLKSIRILTVDDHPVVRNGIAGLVEDQADMLLVGEASNGREAIQQFRAHRPDVTLMDLQMPEMSEISRGSTQSLRLNSKKSCWTSQEGLHNRSLMAVGAN